jgi:uncharacterized protein (DUF342 family)
MSESKESKNFIVSIKNSSMEAYVKISQPEDDNLYHCEQIIAALKDNNVTYGIDRVAIESAIQQGQYNLDILVARGTQPIEGTVGFYDYFFDQTIDSKPRVLEDGTVDYYAMTRIVTVLEGEKIIEYHPAVQGTNGVDVTGKEIKALPVRDLSIIKGKGFLLSDDRRFYTAALTGKIELQNDHLLITNVLEIKEDIDYLQGDVHFKGDLMIYGSVSSGMFIEADGNITIRGHVEGATIVAGKDVVFESGMQGAGKGTVIAGGSIRGKFFEQVDMKAVKEVTANAIMNCNVEAGESIVVTGKRGIILGGSVTALETITASTIGNLAEIKTNVNAGVLTDINLEIKQLNEKIEQHKRRLEQITDAMDMIEEREVNGHKNPFESQKLALMRAKISANTEIAEFQQQKATLIGKLQRSRDAKIIVTKAIYPKTMVSVNGVSLKIEASLAEVIFIRRGDEVLMQNL